MDPIITLTLIMLPFWFLIGLGIIAWTIVAVGWASTGLRRVRERGTMKRFLLSVVGVASTALVFVAVAGAQTVPAVPVDAYGGSLLDGIVSALTDILPWAAAITAFAIGVGMLRRWLGHRKATKV